MAPSSPTRTTYQALARVDTEPIALLTVPDDFLAPHPAAPAAHFTNLPNTYTDSVNDEGGSHDLSVPSIPASPAKDKGKHKSLGPSATSTSSISVGYSSEMSDTWKGKAQCQVADGLQDLNKKLNGSRAENLVHMQDLYEQYAALAASIASLKAPGGSISSADSTQLRTAHNSVVKAVMEISNKQQLLSAEVSRIAAKLEAILDTMKRLEVPAPTQLPESKGHHIETEVPILSIDDMMIEGAAATIHAVGPLPSIAYPAPQPIAPYMVAAPPTLPNITPGAILDAPAPAASFCPNEKWSVRIGPLNWAGDVTGCVLALVCLTQWASRISHLVRAHHDGNLFAFATWKSEQEAQDFFEAWHEAPPAQYASLSASLNF
ncbi:hypothetical protein C8J56DRAFT_885581 [Mycena floridula]|nr:hypothetical protein C8J56DRAFT_885581 [Mycena floridula]